MELPGALPNAPRTHTTCVEVSLLFFVPGLAVRPRHFVFEAFRYLVVRKCARMPGEEVPPKLLAVLVFCCFCRQPILTGTSVLAIKYADGVMMSSDTLASYGGLARFTNIVRLHPVGENTLIGCTGDLSDFDRIKEDLKELIIQDFCEDDGAHCRFLLPISSARFFRIRTRRVASSLLVFHAQVIMLPRPISMRICHDFCTTSAPRWILTGPALLWAVSHKEKPSWASLTSWA